MSEKLALAEVLEDAEEKANRRMKKLNYDGPQIFLKVPVRVEPDDGTPPFEANMKFGLLQFYLLKPGIRVLVSYNPRKKKEVTLADDPASILDRNPLLKKDGEA